MKKNACLLLAILLIASTLLVFTACVEEPEDNKGDKPSKIYLTLENYTQYLEITAECRPRSPYNDLLWGESRYHDVVCTAKVSSTSTFVKFYECSIEMTIEGYFWASWKRNIFEIVTVNLSLGGTGSITKTITDASATDDMAIEECEVLSISGYVIVE